MINVTRRDSYALMESQMKTETEREVFFEDPEQANTADYDSAKLESAAAVLKRLGYEWDAEAHVFARPPEVAEA